MKTLQRYALADELIVLEKHQISFQASSLYCRSIFSASLLEVSFLSRNIFRQPGPKNASV